MNPGTDRTRTGINSMSPASGPMTPSADLLLKPPLPGYSRPVFQRSEMGRLLTLSMLFSCLLLLARMIHTGRLTFVFLVWNLFLAWLPYLITEGLWGRGGASGKGGLWGKGGATANPGSLRSRSFRRLTRRALFVSAGLAWLFFIPNSFYILTDLYHVGDWYNDRLMPAWYDLIMILSFAWNGLLLGVLSVRRMEKILLPLLPAHNEIFFLYPVMWVNALGVYIGRYLRFNTWDLLTNPFQLFGDIAGILLHPLQNRYAWDMIFCFSVLMTLIYLMLKRIGKALA